MHVVCITEKLNEKYIEFFLSYNIGALVKIFIAAFEELKLVNSKPMQGNYLIVHIIFLSFISDFIQFVFLFFA